MTQLSVAYLNFLNDSNSPGVVDPEEASELVDIASNLNVQGNGCCGSKSSKGDVELYQLVYEHGDRFEPAALGIVENYLQSQNIIGGPSVPVVIGPNGVRGKGVKAAKPVPTQSRAFDWGYLGGNRKVANKGTQHPVPQSNLAKK